MTTLLKSEINQTAHNDEQALHGNEKPEPVHDELRFYGGLFMILVWLVL